MYRDDPEKKMAATLKFTNDTLEMSALDEPYQALPSASIWATEPLTLLESIAKVPDWQVTKTGKLSIF